MKHLKIERKSRGWNEMIRELMHNPIFLAGLGKMYACDERFKKNIDKQVAGTAEFVAEAIEIYFRGK